MATPRAVARGLRKTAGRIARIPDEAVSAAAELGVELGATGGSMFGSPLYAEVRDVSRKRGVSSATIAGVGAGGWSIKSYGRRGGYIVAPRSRNRRAAVNLRGAGVTANGRRISAARSVRPGPARGDDRWNKRVADPVREEFPELLAELAASAAEA